MLLNARPVFRLLLTLALVGLTIMPGWAEPTEDPRDQQIKALRQQVEQQSQQIQDLQQTMKELKELVKGKSEAQAEAPKPASPENTAQTPPPAVPPVATGGDEEEEGPGPEPPPPMQQTSSMASSSATEQQPSMNPNLSVIGLFEGKAGGAPYDPTSNSMYLREVELALQAPIDPYARADIFLTFPRNEAPGVEEAALTWTGLPGGLQAKGGLLRGDFGRINQLHTHAYPQIDLPLVNQAVFGPESFRDPGVEMSWLAPTPWYSRFSVQALSRSEGPDANSATTLDLSTPPDGETVANILSQSDNFGIFPSSGGKGLLYVGRWENLWDLNENTTLQLGLSGANANIAASDLQSSSAYGADLTLKWKPVNKLGKALTWQTEYIKARENFLSGRRDFGGWYSFVNYRFNRFWGAGARYGQTEMPFDPSLKRRRATALLEWIPSEWNRLRFQYSHNSSNFDRDFDEFMVQWNIVLGPHGAHKY